MKERLGSIYVLHNLMNEKEYVGQTIKEPEVRWAQHLNAAFKYCAQTPLYRAMRKNKRETGRLNFTAEVIWRCSESKLNAAEKRIVRWHKTFIDTGWGYNLTTGGGHFRMSKRAIRKLRRSLLKYYENPAARAYQSAKTFEANARDPTIIQRANAKKIGKKDSYYVRKKKSKAQLRRVYTDEQKAEYTARGRALWLGKKLSPAHCESISKSQRGTKRKPCPPEVRAKISAAQKGKIIPQWQRDQISKTLMGNIPWNKGKKLSPAHRAALSKGHMGKSWTAKQRLAREATAARKRAQ
jgi:hypothetical protein